MSDDLEERVAAYLIRYGDEGVFLPKKDAKELIAMFKQDVVEAVEEYYRYRNPRHTLSAEYRELIKAINQL